MFYSLELPKVYFSRLLCVLLRLSEHSQNSGFVFLFLETVMGLTSLLCAYGGLGE